MAVTKQQARLAINAIRAAVGVGGLVAPRLTSRVFAIDPGDNPALPYMTRLFAVRELFMAGVGSTEDASDELFRYGMAIDGVDFVAGLLSIGRGSVPKRALVTATGGLALALWLGRLASQPDDRVAADRT